MRAVKVVTFGVLLPLLTLSVAQSPCKYLQHLESGKSYYVYNQEYPNQYMHENHCTWQTISLSVIKIKCNIEIPASQNCAQDSLSIRSPGRNIDKYCGYNNFTYEGENVTIYFDSSYYTQGGRFLCQMQTEKPFDENNCQCGWKNPTRIVGGEETGINEYPMMAGLVDSGKRELYCGATIISENYVVTAAHCVEEKNLSKIGVLVGDHDVTTGDDTSAAKLYLMQGCTIHPYYKDILNDIAVCQIVGKIQYSARVGPVCLPFQHRCDSFGGSIVKALGWGLLEFGGTKATTLQGVNLNVISLQKCKNYYNVTNYHICTFTPEKDACQMDSGGPLLWKNPTTHNIVLTGIISAGMGCGSGIPSVNTRAGAYVDWIESVTGKNQQGKVNKSQISFARNLLNCENKI
ncbi:PREDICTED: venom serine protease-like [Dinoponera quadriceps]|uniref:Venom serine protease-like n=1 Tax=Dinoponera quadriceps TaxID=609295 RepID=A0A6P3XG77_DINQU|nr:PREDICTED: venom serine protease-like [Dinoponera quadriceps]